MAAEHSEPNPFQACPECGSNGPRCPGTVRPASGCCWFVPPPEPILRATVWKSNAELIRDVATLGYIVGNTLDCTWGMGVFWKLYRPESLVGTDGNAAKSPVGYPVDFREMPFGDKSFDTVVFDPPYRLNGRPTQTFDERYGTDERTSTKDRIKLILDGVQECARVARKRVLVKCMDQVVSGNVYWQTDEITALAADCRLTKIDRFDMLHTPRKQPHDDQVHARANYSTLLIFTKKGGQAH